MQCNFFIINKIVHRNLKPSNIYLDSHYHPFLSNFNMDILLMHHCLIILFKNHLNIPLLNSLKIIKIIDVHLKLMFIHLD